MKKPNKITENLKIEVNTKSTFQLDPHDHDHHHADHNHNEKKSCCGDCEGNGTCKRFQFELIESSVPKSKTNK